MQNRIFVSFALMLCAATGTCAVTGQDKSLAPRMSKFTEHRDGGTCQEKLAPPRSLRAEGKDAEMIWNVIVKRYPRAAPLLCEMEVAIERAENLLHNFRTAPYSDVKEIERPSLTRSSISDESSSMLTANSATQLSTSDENDEGTEVGTRMSDDFTSKSEDQINASSSSSNSDNTVDRQDYGTECSRSIPQLTVDESTSAEDIRSSVAEKNPQKGKGDNSINSTSQKQEPRILVRTEEVFKLDEREKVVVGKAITSERVNDEKEEIPQKDPTKETVKKIAEGKPLSTKAPTEVLEDTVSSPRKVTGTTEEIQSKITKIPRMEVSPNPKRRTRTTSGISPIRSAKTQSAPICTENEQINSKREKMENDDECDTVTPSKKTPVAMLKEYAVQCNEKLEFKATGTKPNSYMIECSFASHTAKSVGCSESSVENDVAAKILRMLADEQMDEKVMKNLIPFSNEQMRDVIALGTDDQPENAMRKLYKLCLEKNAPKPLYSVQKDFVSGGVTNTAKCTAFNITTTGVGIRGNMAKISAAEKLYTQLLPEQSWRNK